MATAKPLAERITKRMLDALRKRKLKNAEAAEQLGVSETYLSRVVASMQDKEPGKTVAGREAARLLYRTRLEFRDKLAKRIIKGEITMAKAVREAKCSERTMFRHIEKYRAEQAKRGPKKGGKK